MGCRPFADAGRAAALSLVLLSACNWGHGAPVDRAEFGSAELHPDGARFVFALHDAVYRLAEGMRALPDGGVPRYDVDRHSGCAFATSGNATLPCVASVAQRHLSAAGPGPVAFAL